MDVVRKNKKSNDQQEKNEIRRINGDRCKH